MGDSMLELAGESYMYTNYLRNLTLAGKFVGVIQDTDLKVTDNGGSDETANIAAGDVSKIGVATYNNAGDSVDLSGISANKWVAIVLKYSDSAIHYYTTGGGEDAGTGDDEPPSPSYTTYYTLAVIKMDASGYVVNANIVDCRAFLENTLINTTDKEYLDGEAMLRNVGHDSQATGRYRLVPIPLLGCDIGAAGNNAARTTLGLHIDAIELPTGVNSWVDIDLMGDLTKLVGIRFSIVGDTSEGGTYVVMTLSHSKVAAGSGYVAGPAFDRSESKKVINSALDIKIGHFKFSDASGGSDVDEDEIVTLRLTRSGVSGDDTYSHSMYLVALAAIYEHSQGLADADLDQNFTPV